LLGRVAESTSQAYRRAWRGWEAWREEIGKERLLDTSLGEMEVAQELAAFAAFCAYELKNKESTIA